MLKLISYTMNTTASVFDVDSKTMRRNDSSDTFPRRLFQSKSKKMTNQL